MLEQWSLSSQELNFERYMDIDTRIIGSYLGSGAYHDVFKYCQDRVIKFRRKQTVRAAQNFTEVSQDLKIAQDYFGAWIVPSKVHPAQTNRDGYCLTQELLEPFLPFSPDSMGTVWPAFVELIRENRQLISRESVSLDLFGRTAMLKAITSDDNVYFGNVCLAQANGTPPRLVVPDWSLYKLSFDHYPNTPQGIFDYSIIQAVHYIQERLIAYHFGL